MYKSFVKPFLQRLEHEHAKDTTIDILHSLESTKVGLRIIEYLGASHHRFEDKRLHTTIAGIHFDNPFLLAAGWDREARAVKAMYELGFGGVEIGTVTAYPQPGNARPRLHLLDKDVALNHFGFSGPGMEIVAQNLERYRNSQIPIGISVTKNKYISPAGAALLYAIVVRRLYEYGSYFVLNVSSPNTVGLKVLQQKEYLDEIVKEVIAMMEDIGERKPIFIKIAPDIPYNILDGVIQTVIDFDLSGIIAVNTFPHQNTIAKYGVSWEDRQGGLSGNDKHYRDIATKYIAYIHKVTEGKVPIIGVGGIHDTQTALEKIVAGASLIQTLTGLIAEGPTLPGKVNRGIAAFLETQGVKNISDIVGVEDKNILDNPKRIYSFSFISKSSKQSLTKEYLNALFPQQKFDTLLISNSPYTLKHGEMGRKSSHIYLNHRIPLFSHKEYRELFVKIFQFLINENSSNNKVGLISIPTSGSAELVNNLLREIDQAEKITILSRQTVKNEKGTFTQIYGTLEDKRNWYLIDDVFTSGKTMRESLDVLKTNKLLPINRQAFSLVARNINTVKDFEKDTITSLTPFITLDEVLQYHWNNFSTQQKKLIRQERPALN